MDYENPGPVEENWRDAISSVEEIIEDARNGRMFILVDHEDRENEGDLVIPAQMATPEAINFMATHGRGLICLSLTGERCDGRLIIRKPHRILRRRGMCFHCARAMAGCWCARAIQRRRWMCRAWPGFIGRSDDRCAGFGADACDGPDAGCDWSGATGAAQ